MRSVTTVSVSTSRVLGHVDRRIYGGFVEHLGRCIYGGLYDEGSPLSDAKGFRLDVLALLKDLKLAVLRWPGGNFVSNYHWEDGVGPKDSRPARLDLAWGGVESNRFGTDEFIEYCSRIGAEPYICLNMGTGTLAEALAWVEYCTGKGPTHWAGLREKGGHAEPFKVNLWGLGNEMYGPWQAGALSAEEYVAEATRWARAIRMVDPEAKLVSCGEFGWSDWDVKVIDALASLVDYHSLHLYTGSEDYWVDVLAPHNAERAIRTASALLARAAYNQGLERAPRLAYDEWNVWFRAMQGGLEERYSFPDALAVGTFLNIFVRNSAWVAMANLAQMVNAIAPIVTTPQGAVVQPIYHPFALHAQGHLEVAVDAHVQGPTIEAPPQWPSRWPQQVQDLGPFPLVDVAATRDKESRQLAVTLVNRSEEAELVDVFSSPAAFTGAAKLTCATGTGRHAPGTGVEDTNVTTESVPLTGSRLAAELPPRSFVLLQVNLEA